MRTKDDALKYPMDGDHWVKRRKDGTVITKRIITGVTIRGVSAKDYRSKCEYRIDDMYIAAFQRWAKDAEFAGNRPTVSDWLRRNASV